MEKRTLGLGLAASLAIFLLVGASAPANASTVGSMRNIDYILVNTVGIYIYTSADEEPGPDFSRCSTNHRIILSYDHPNFKHLYALLLAAWSSDSRLKVWANDTESSCVDGSPTVRLLQVGK